MLKAIKSQWRSAFKERCAFFSWARTTKKRTSFWHSKGNNRNLNPRTRCKITLKHMDIESLCKEILQETIRGNRVEPELTGRLHKESLRQLCQNNGLAT